METVQGRTGSHTFREVYSYTQPGQLSSRSLQIQSGSYSTSLAQKWTYDNEGRVTSVSYPAAGLNQDGSNSRAQSYSYGYEIMGRLSTMQSTVSPNPPTNVVTGTTYGPADELLTISFSGRPNETRTYNSLLQLTTLNESTFSYPAGLNNGRIQSETNTTTGEQVTYAYDKLNRLISVVTTDNPNVTQWGQQFVYDGFGNLREKNVIKGSAPTLSVLVDAATNRLPLYQYDANGKQLTTNTQTLTYNYENRLSQATTASNAWTKYNYDPDGRRVYSKEQLNTTITERVYMYGLGNELMATYILKTSGTSVYTVLESHRGYFGSRLTEQGTNNSGGYTVTAVTPTRLGSVGKNYSYGETGSTGTIFATYTRDSDGLDYALNRYYNSTLGRFMTPDPYGGSMDPSNPQSFNRYAYVMGDPVNNNDPSGTIIAYGGGGLCTVGAGEGAEVTLCDMFVGTRGVMQPAPNTYVNEWNNLSTDCQDALKVAMPGKDSDQNVTKRVQALNGAFANERTLENAVKGTGIDWTMLAAIGVRESGWIDKNEADGAGVGVGIFQITVNNNNQDPSKGPTVSQANNTAWAAGYAANLLNSNMSYLGSRFPKFTSEQLLQATAASYNMNPYKPGNFTGNPNTIDSGTAHGNYGSNILQLMGCFH